MRMYDINGNKLEKLFDIHGDVIWAEDAADLVVMSYNVQKCGGMNSYEIQQEIVTKYKPDIIGMQEYRDYYEDQGAYSEYPYIANNSTHLQNFDGILSKYELKDTGGALFTDNYPDPTAYVFGTITFDGKDIFVLNVHLSPYGDDYSVYRASQVQEILSMLQDKEYFIITGDFNSLTVQDGTEEEYAAIYQPFVDMGCHLANCCEKFGFQRTYTSSKTIDGARWLKLDNVITSPNIEIVNATVDETKLDYVNGLNEIDHFPVIAYLKFN